MEVITIQSEAFRQIMDKLNGIDQKLESQKPKPALKDTWFDIQEACFILKVSKRTLQNYRKDRVLPYSKIDGKIYFKADDIQKHLERNYKKIRR